MEPHYGKHLFPGIKSEPGFSVKSVGRTWTRRTLASDTEADSIMTPTRPTVPTPTTGRISKYTSYTSKNLSGPPSKPVDPHYFVGTLYEADPSQLVRQQTLFET